MLRRLPPLVIMLIVIMLITVMLAYPVTAQEAPTVEIEEFAVPAGASPHDVAPAPDGRVWYTAQRQGALGKLDPATGTTHQIPLGAGSAPHGVIVGPAGEA